MMLSQIEGSVIYEDRSMRIKVRWQHGEERVEDYVTETEVIPKQARTRRTL